MNLRNKIALTFTLLTTGIMVVASLVVYWQAKAYSQQDFLMRLKERSQIAAQLYLDEDEMSQRMYQEIWEEHLHALPVEREYLIEYDQIENEKHNLPDFIGSNFLRELDTFGFATLQAGLTYAAGIRYTGSRGEFAVIVSAQDDWGEKKLNNLKTILISIIIIYLLMVFFLGRWYAKSVLKPLSSMVSQMEQINTQNLHRRLNESRSNDEIGRLANTFNNMLNRIETSVETQNNFISNASHELKNPLTAILTEAEVTLSRDRSPKEYKQALENIAKESDRLRSLTLKLLKLAQTSFTEEGMEFESVRADELVFDVKEEIGAILPDQKLSIHLNSLPQNAEALEIKGNKQLLKIALMNIVENAIKFSSNAAIDLYLSGNEKVVEFEISDSGVGIPPLDISKVYSPFFRSENVRSVHGFGIGLPLVKKIMDLHGGKIEISSQLKMGTRVKLTFFHKKG